MSSNVPLDYAVFQLSPRRSRCELFVSYGGSTEMLASGLVEPFVTHLKIAQEQVALAVKSIKLEVDRYYNADTWFTKGTIERFVQFVGAPEVLEAVNTLDAEMSQLETDLRIYSQGAGDGHSSASGGEGGASAASDATKKVLLRAFDVRLVAVKQDLITACTHASAAGFNPETITELKLFADHFGAHRLSEACGKFITLTQQRADLFNNHNPFSTSKSSSELALRSSCSSDMSVDEPCDDQPKHSTFPPNSTKVTFPLRRFSRELSPSPVEGGEVKEYSKPKDIENDKATGPTTSSVSMSVSDPSLTMSTHTPQLTRRLSVQERISMFENKAQKVNSPSTTTVASGGGKPELRRLSSDVTSSTDKAVLRRQNGASDMSIDVSGEKNEPDSSANTPTPTSTSMSHSVFLPKPKDHCDTKSEEGLIESKVPVNSKFGFHLASGLELAASEANIKITSMHGRSSESVKPKDQPSVGFRLNVVPSGNVVEFGLENQQSVFKTQFKSKPGKAEEFGFSDQTTSEEKVTSFPGGGSKPQQDSGMNVGTTSSSCDGRSGVLQDEDEDERVSDNPVPMSTFRMSHKQTVGVSSESVALEAHSQPSMLAQPRRRSAGGEIRKSGRKDSESIESQAKMDTSGSYRGKFYGHGSAVDQVKKPGAKREDSGTMIQMGSTENFAPMKQDVCSSSVDQVNRLRLAKGNLDLNDELKMKANELEKLFAEHKLRAPSDQSNLASRTRPVDTPMEQEMASPLQITSMKPAGISKKEKMSTPLLKTVDSQEYDVTPKQNIYSLSFSDDSRGKSYKKYMQKRDAKLSEDWSSNGAEREAKMKAMQDSLEKSRAEMKVKLAGSAGKKTSASDSRQRAEKMRSLNVRSAMKREQTLS